MRKMLGRLLCWWGRHEGQYELGEFDGTRKCSRCGLDQPLIKEFGKWFA